MYYAALIVIAVIFIWRVTAGFKKGMVKEITSFISMVLAGISAIILFNIVGNYFDQSFGKMIQMIIALLLVTLIYKVLNFIFSSVKLIAKLPVIHGIDKLLGGVVGAVEALALVCILVYFIKGWGVGQLM